MLERGERRAHPRTRRALFLLALLAAPTLLAASGPAAGQADDAPVPEVRVLRRHVLEGTNVTIVVHDHGTADEVSVKCVSCPDAAQDYRARAKSVLVFPRDFGERANRESQPRWNATWEVQLLKNGVVPVVGANATFNSWIVNLYDFPERIVEPGDRLFFGTSGYPENPPVPVRIRLQKVDDQKPAEWETIWDWQGLQPVDGRISVWYKFSPRMAELVRCPQDPLERCRDFRVIVEGGGKNTEVTNFYVRPARVKTHVLSEPSPEGEAMARINRTFNVKAEFQLFYRDGVEMLTFLSYKFGDGPKYAVERLTGNELVNATRVHNGTARWSEATFAWVANWSIARDTPLKDANGIPYRYRFVVLAQEDPVRNDVERHAFNPFEVTPWTFPLVWEKAPVSVERTAKAAWKVNLTYANGKPFTQADNQSQLRFCVVPVAELVPDRLPCFNRKTFPATYERWATWRVNHQWDINDPRVNQDWVLAPAWDSTDPVTDAYGNPVGTARSVFNLTVAHPTVSLVTQVGQEKREGRVPIERGDTVRVTARILYPDGKTPFNWSRSADGRKLPMDVVLRNNLGDVVGVQTVELTNPGNADTWVGSFAVGRTADAAPAGTWQLRFDLRDKEREPNRNATSFDRVVAPASILVATVREPPLTTDLGETVTWRFRMAYRDGTAVTGDTPGLLVRTEIRPARPGAAPVATLAPAWDPDRKEWYADWTPALNLPLEKYVFVPTGQDLSGNLVRGDVTSRPLLLVTDVLERSVLSQPPPRVPRGDTVVVVFDGRDGDVGSNNTHAPRIVVERFDSRAQGWFPEVLDVRAADEPGEEHVGIWNTTLATQAGTYRFRLFGKDAQYAFINATSRPFVLELVQVNRLSLLNGTNATKGDVVRAEVERQDGDRFREAYVVLDGRRFENVPKFGQHSDRFWAEWKIPYTFPTGAFTIVMVSVDRHGNDAVGEVGPYFVSASSVRSDTVVDPVRIVQRGKNAEWSFRSFYPSGDKLGGMSGLPEVVVVNESGPVANAVVVTDGPNYRATWEPSRTVGLDDYWFEVAGRDAFGNEFLPIRSEAFRVEPGVYGRTIDLLPPPTNDRSQLTGFRIHTDPADKVLEAVVVRLRADNARAAVNNFNGQVVAKADVRLSDDGRVWIAEWLPQRDSPLGWYRFRFDGFDVHGNRIEQWSGAFLLQPSELIVEVKEQSRTIEPSVPFTARFRVRYPDQTNLTGSDGRVTVQAMRDNQITPPEVEVRWDGELWSAVWETPEQLAQGRYALVVLGFDVLGNSILRTPTSAVSYEPTNVEKLLGVPAPGALLLLALAAGLALARRRR